MGSATDTASSAIDLGRQVIDEQVGLVRRWGEAAERYTGGLRRLSEGEIDTVTFSREVADDAIREGVHSLEVAARVGMHYYQFVAGLVDPKSGRAPSTDAEDTPDTW